MCSAYNTMGGTLSAVLRSEGMRGLYSGVGATLLGALPFEGIKFGTNDYLRQRLPHDANGRVLPLYSLVAGAVAGAEAAASFDMVASAPASWAKAAGAAIRASAAPAAKNCVLRVMSVISCSAHSHHKPVNLTEGCASGAKISRACEGPERTKPGRRAPAPPPWDAGGAGPEGSSACANA